MNHTFYRSVGSQKYSLSKIRNTSDVQMEGDKIRGIVGHPIVPFQLDGAPLSEADLQRSPLAPIGSEKKLAAFTDIAFKWVSDYIEKGGTLKDEGSKYKGYVPSYPRHTPKIEWGQFSKTGITGSSQGQAPLKKRTPTTVPHDISFPPNLSVLNIGNEGKVGDLANSTSSPNEV